MSIRCQREVLSVLTNKLLEFWIPLIIFCKSEVNSLEYFGFSRRLLRRFLIVKSMSLSMLEGAGYLHGQFFGLTLEPSPSFRFSTEKLSDSSSWSFLRFNSSFSRFLKAFVKHRRVLEDAWRVLKTSLRFLKFSNFHKSMKV